MICQDISDVLFILNLLVIVAKLSQMREKLGEKW